MNDTLTPGGLEARAGATSQRTRPSRGSDQRDIGIVLLTGLLVRGLVLRVLPPNAVSYDLRAWQEVAGFLAAGQNPYNLQPYLSWPPAWMQIVYFLDHLARHLALTLTLVLRIFLILADGLGVLLVGRLIRRLTPISFLWPLLVGWSLNPIAILLVCQHGNFDGLVALCIIGAVLCLIEFVEQRDPVTWLWACCWLGLGVALKTIPIVLAPLLTIGRSSSRKVLALGLLLVVGPALYGLSIIYALGPAQVKAHVLGYGGLPGWFGITGLLTIAGRQAWVPIYRKLFALALVLGMAGLADRVTRRVSARGIVFSAAAILAAIPALGPGYGDQYIAWSFPLLLVLWAIGDRRTRAVLLGFGSIAVVTYVLDYALMPSHGAFLLTATSSSTVVRISQLLATRRGSTLERLPLFLAYLVLVVHLIGAARRELDPAPATPPT
jgi:hypothetical protein